jgi:salicylate hydroxylase
MTLGDNGSSIFVYRQPQGVHFSYTLRSADEASVAAKSKPELLDTIKAGTRGWHPLVQQIVETADPSSLLVRGYYDKQPIQKVHDDNVWLLGDAAHPMCPFQGQGANMAMLDALKIADFLVAQEKTSQAGVTAAALEADIVKRGRKAVLESRNAADQFHTTNGLKRFNRNLGFRVANMMIQMFSKQEHIA